MENKVKIFTGTANPALGEAIAKAAGYELGKCTIKKFSDGEISVVVDESVRGCDVYFIQSTCAPANDNLMEILIMTDALRRAGAKRIIAVIPYFGYARQERKTKARDPISAKLVANLLTTAGIDHVLTMDIHAAQIQGFFDIPFDNLLGSSVLLPYFEKTVGIGNPDYVVVSPDFGAVARSRKFAEKLGLPLAIIEKRRPMANVSEVMSIIGDVKGKHAILLDDMIDTAGTLCHGAKAIIEVGGALSVTACASHGVLSGPAIQRITDSVMDKVLVLDTIPVPEEKMCEKLGVISVAEHFGEAIRRMVNDDSVSELYI
ncbi:MAG: ribose-phosphate pyrophosphokinase [Clostridia bacterium]|nr:ribose-phosphate pyrophosphokinase [Clostridia bacterium]